MTTRADKILLKCLLPMSLYTSKHVKIKRQPKKRDMINLVMRTDWVDLKRIHKDFGI
jgi:hypothetical protein